MTTRASNAELHAAVLAAPDDDGPRLVYADWLIEHGDPRGELIVLQIARSRLPADDLKAAELKQRERALWDAHGESWFAPFRTPAGDVNATFERGFPETLSANAAIALSAMPDALFDDTCIRTLSWRRGSNDVVFELLHNGNGGFLRRMGVGFGWHSDSNTALVATIERHLPRMRLRKLAIGESELSKESLRALLAALEAGPTRLAEFDLSASNLDSDHVAAIVSSPAFEGLRSLRLHCQRFDSVTLRSLGAWAHGGLRELSLAGCPIGTGLLGTIIALPAFASLERLDLARTKIGADDVRAIVDARLPLVALELGGNTLGPTIAEHLAREGFGDQLERLGLASTGIGLAGLDVLVASKLPRLELGLDGYVLGLEEDVWYDGARVTGSSWKGPPPSALAARFQLAIEGTPQC